MNPSTPTTVTLVGAKGGVGTSTIAAALAFRLGRCGATVRLSTTDAAGLNALSFLVAATPPLEPGQPMEIADNVTLADRLDPGCWNVVDGGTDRTASHPGLVLVVVRNTRLALQSLLTVPASTRGLVMVKEKGQRSVDEQLQGMCTLMTWARYFGPGSVEAPTAADTAVTGAGPVPGLRADRDANRIRLVHPVVAQVNVCRSVATAVDERGLDYVLNLPALDGLEVLCQPEFWPVPADRHQP